MKIFLTRHGKAGSRLPDYKDRYRQLSDKGLIQAQTLASYTRACNLTLQTITSSPATRCVQTVQPTATKSFVTIQEDERLWEEALPSKALEVFDGLMGDAVVCTHGNLIPEMIRQLHLAGATVTGSDCAKGSVWVIEGTPGNWSSATYISPQEMLD